jgi:hypothetical protein
MRDDRASLGHFGGERAIRGPVRLLVQDVWFDGVANRLWRRAAPLPSDGDRSRSTRKTPTRADTC